MDAHASGKLLFMSTLVTANNANNAATSPLLLTADTILVRMPRLEFSPIV